MVVLSKTMGMSTRQESLDVQVRCRSVVHVYAAGAMVRLE